MIKTKNWQFIDWLDYYCMIKQTGIINFLSQSKSLKELKLQAAMLDDFCKINFEDKRKKDLINALRERYYKAGRITADSYDRFMRDIYDFQYQASNILKGKDIDMLVRKLGGDYLGKVIETCNECNGTGKGAWENFECFLCLGKGVILDQFQS